MNIWLFLLVLGYFMFSEAFKVAGNVVLADWTGNLHVAICLDYEGKKTPEERKGGKLFPSSLSFTLFIMTLHGTLGFLIS